MSFTRAIRLSPNVTRKKKKKKLERNRLQTYSTLAVGFAVAMDRQLYFGWALRSVAMQRELHYWTESLPWYFSPPRDSFYARNCTATQRNDPRRFYYTALKPWLDYIYKVTDRNWPLCNTDSELLQKFGVLIVILIFVISRNLAPSMRSIFAMRFIFALFEN